MKQRFIKANRNLFIGEDFSARHFLAEEDVMVVRPRKFILHDYLIPGLGHGKFHRLVRAGWRGSMV